MRNADDEHDAPAAPAPARLGPPERVRGLLPDHTDEPPPSADLPESFGAGRGAGADVEAFGTGAPTEHKEKKNESDEADRKPSRGDRRTTGKPDEKDEKEKEDDKEEKGAKDDQKNENEQGKKGGDEEDEEDEKQPRKPPLYKRPAFVIALVVGVIVAIAVAVIWWLYARQYEKTDDAYIDGNVTQISPQVSAPVQARHVDDNQFVHKGDLMIELDPTDFQVALQQAKANVEASRGKLTQSQSQIGAANAVVDQNNAEIAAAQVQLDNASRDLQRYQNVDPLARSQQQLDNAAAAQKNAAAQVDQAKARKASAEANVKTAQAAFTAAQGDLDRALADQKRAEVNLSYCSIYAPSDGRVTSRTIEAGMYVNTGEVMFSLVAPEVWVTANFKETQLDHMQLGQPVQIKVDAYPHVKWQGHVESIQAGSGSRFSVLPAENATGNFVKIVQRVPVKIAFDPGTNTNDSHLLSPGMSVEPRVKVR